MRGFFGVGGGLPIGEGAVGVVLMGEKKGRGGTEERMERVGRMMSKRWG